MLSLFALDRTFRSMKVLYVQNSVCYEFLFGICLQEEGFVSTLYKPELSFAVITPFMNIDN